MELTENKEEIVSQEDILREYMMPVEGATGYPFKMLIDRPASMTHEVYKLIMRMQDKRIKHYKLGTMYHESRYGVDKVNIKGEKETKMVSSTYRKADASNNNSRGNRAD